MKKQQRTDTDSGLKYTLFNQGKEQGTTGERKESNDTEEVKLRQSTRSTRQSNQKQKVI